MAPSCGASGSRGVYVPALIGLTVHFTDPAADEGVRSASRMIVRSASSVVKDPAVPFGPIARLMLIVTLGSPQDSEDRRAPEAALAVPERVDCPHPGGVMSLIFTAANAESARPSTLPIAHMLPDFAIVLVHTSPAVEEVHSAGVKSVAPSGTNCHLLTTTTAGSFSAAAVKVTGVPA